MNPDPSHDCSGCRSLLSLVEDLRERLAATNKHIDELAQARGLLTFTEADLGRLVQMGIETERVIVPVSLVNEHEKLLKASRHALSVGLPEGASYLQWMEQAVGRVRKWNDFRSYSEGYEWRPGPV